MLGLGLSITRVAVAARKALLAVLNISGSKGLVYDKAGGKLVNNRTSTATVTDFEGLVKTAKVNEIRFSGGRRVENLISSSESLLSPSWAVAGNTLIINSTDLDLGAINSGNDSIQEISIKATGIGEVYRATFNIKTDGTISILFQDGVTQVNKQVDALIEEKVSVILNVVGNTLNFKLKRFSYSTARFVTIKNIQIEEVTNQTNQLPSEYIPTGTGLIQNSGLEGVAYFDYLNGNSVDANGIVTESQGSAIVPKPTMLSEGVGSNLFINSEDFSQTSWAKNNASVGLSANVSNINMQQMVDNAVFNQYRFSKGINAVVNTDYTLSAFLKKSGNRYAVLWIFGLDSAATLARCFFDLQTGTISALQSGSASIVDLGNGLYRCSVTANSGFNTAILNIIQSTQSNASLSYLGTNTAVLEVGGAQLEKGLQATSYIPTTVAAVSRSADNIHLPLIVGTNFNQSEGMLIVRNIIGWGNIKEANTNQQGVLTTSNSSLGLLSQRSGGVGVLGIATTSHEVGGNYSGIFGSWQQDDDMLMAVVWSVAGNYLVNGLSMDNGTTWTWSTTPSFIGAFAVGSDINLFYSNQFKNNLISAQLYDKLPKPTVAETKTWVENNAGALTQ